MTRFHDKDFGFAVRNYFPFISLRYWGFLYVFVPWVFWTLGEADAGVGFLLRVVVFKLTFVTINLSFFCVIFFPSLFFPFFLFFLGRV